MLTEKCVPYCTEHVRQEKRSLLMHLCLLSKCGSYYEARSNCVCEPCADCLKAFQPPESAVSVSWSKLVVTASSWQTFFLHAFQMREERNDSGGALEFEVVPEQCLRNDYIEFVLGMPINQVLETSLVSWLGNIISATKRSKNQEYWTGVLEEGTAFARHLHLLDQWRCPSFFRSGGASSQGLQDSLPAIHSASRGG